MNALVTHLNELHTKLRFGAVGPHGLQGKLFYANGDCSTLPGQPRIELDTLDSDEYLEKEHLVPDLDRLAPKLWLVSTPRSRHVSPLHHQAVRGRRIVVTENPQLHLVWFYDRIFIKPIPRYLLSHAFWQYLQTKSNVYQAATGFLRTYSYLIRYETDFRLAISDTLNLIPSDGGEEPITFERFISFIRPFSMVDDSSVNPRYRYGELRLTRLNMCARLFLGKLTFHHIDAQWSSYLGRFLAPMLSAFALFSVVLSAMQVGLAAQKPLKGPHNLMTFSGISLYFSLAIIFLTSFGILLLGALIVFMFIHDIWFAQSVLRQERKAQASPQEEFKSGVI